MVGPINYTCARVDSWHRYIYGTFIDMCASCHWKKKKLLTCYAPLKLKQGKAGLTAVNVKSGQYDVAASLQVGYILQLEKDNASSKYSSSLHFSRPAED